MYKEERNGMKHDKTKSNETAEWNQTKQIKRAQNVYEWNGMHQNGKVWKCGRKTKASKTKRELTKFNRTEKHSTEKNKQIKRSETQHAASKQSQPNKQTQDERIETEARPLPTILH